MKVTIEGKEYDVQPGGDTVTVGGDTFSVRVVRADNVVTVYLDEKPYAVQLPSALPEDGPVKLFVDAKEYEAEVKGAAGARPRPRPKAKKAPAGGTGAVVAQLTGRVIRVDVKPGDVVKEGDILLVIEAMKMENEIAAPVGGSVKSVSVAAGARVAEGDPLVVIEPDTAPAS